MPSGSPATSSAGGLLRRALAVLGVCAVVLGAFALGFLLTRAAPSSSPSAAPLQRDRPITLIDEVRAELTSYYYRWIDPKVLARPSVDEILEGLEDPHTDYLTRTEFQSLQETTQGTYTGIGLTVGPARNGLLVTSALKGPAREAGIREGDVIVRIDGKRAAPLSFEHSLALVKGEAGTLVHLTVRRPKSGKAIDFTVVRRDIEVPPISAHMIELRKRDVAYLRVFSFPSGVAQSLEEATSRLVEMGAEAAIIDLRDNPGGLLSEAVETTSIFLEDGLVCRTDGLHEEAHLYDVTGFATHPELPLVVLVDYGSASAAEIVAGAFADNERATLVGERTFGKASVQTVAPLRDGGALKLTTAKYLTPAGADITSVGISPSTLAVDDPLTESDEALRTARKTLLKVLRG